MTLSKSIALNTQLTVSSAPCLIGNLRPFSYLKMGVLFYKAAYCNSIGYQVRLKMILIIAQPFVFCVVVLLFANYTPK